MRPYKILLASVLKPVDDIRMSQKIGASLARLPTVEVHVAGHCTRHTAQVQELILHPIFCFNRLSVNRAAANLKFFGLIRKLRPQLLIIGTHELLPAAAMAKLAFRIPIIYDVRENYYLNIRHTNAFPGLVRAPLAYIVRGLEQISGPVIDHYLLAEKAYRTELPFIQEKAIVLENKYLLNSEQDAYRELPVRLAFKINIKLIYSGTIASTYGIFEAIRLVNSLHTIDSRYQLTIIGYCAQPDVLKQVKEEVSKAPYIKLIGGDSLVPHRQILDEIRNADVGLLPYKPNPSTFSSIPTKLYEYLANCLPVLVQRNPYWQELVQQWEAGELIDFSKYDPGTIHRFLTNQEFYRKGKPKEVLWDTEEEKLLNLVDHYLKTSEL